jgi:hypothetical protein
MLENLTLNYTVRPKNWFCAGLILAVISNGFVSAEEVKQLAEEVQNPVSDLVRVGFLNNTFFGTGFNNHLTNLFNLNAANTRRLGDWAFLSRLNIPLLYLPANAIGDKTGSLTGLGDIELTGFLARDESKRWFKLVGGLGPTLIFNTATDDRLGSGKWSIGPTLALVSLPAPWVVGAVMRISGRLPVTSNAWILTFLPSNHSSILIFQTAGISRPLRRSRRIGKQTVGIAGRYPLAADLEKSCFEEKNNRSTLDSRDSILLKKSIWDLTGSYRSSFKFYFRIFRRMDRAPQTLQTSSSLVEPILSRWV